MAEVVALAAACGVWEQARDGFARNSIRAKGNQYGAALATPADRRRAVDRHPVPVRPLANEVMLVAELRIAPMREHAGALAGAVYAMPGDWSLEVGKRTAVLTRGGMLLELRPEEVRFVMALARTFARGSKCVETGPAASTPAASTHKPAQELTADEIAEAFRI